MKEFKRGIMIVLQKSFMYRNGQTLINLRVDELCKIIHGAPIPKYNHNKAS
jgi:hypothetical protein